MSRLRHHGWDQCSHGLTSRPSESCHHQCHQAVFGVLGYRKGAAAHLLDGTLKLRCCTAVFARRFFPWSLPGRGGRVRKREVAKTHLSNDGSSTVKRVRLTRKTCPRIPVHSRPNPALPPPKRWNRLAPPGLLRSRRRGGRPWPPRSSFLTCRRRAMDDAIIISASHTDSEVQA